MASPGGVLVAGGGGGLVVRQLGVAIGQKTVGVGMWDKYTKSWINSIFILLHLMRFSFFHILCQSR